MGSLRVVYIIAGMHLFGFGCAHNENEDCSFSVLACTFALILAFSPLKTNNSAQLRTDTDLISRLTVTPSKLEKLRWVKVQGTTGSLSFSHPLQKVVKIEAVADAVID